MHSHETQSAGFQPPANVPQTNPLAPQSFEVTYPGQEHASPSTNPFPRRPHEVSMGPASPTIARAPEDQTQSESERLEKGWLKFDLYAAEQTPPEPPRSHPIQAKLTIGEPNDPYEQEADRVADQVMSMPESAPVQREMALEEEEVQTKPLAATITPLVQRHEMPEDEEVQTKALTNTLQRHEMLEEGEAVQTKPSLQRAKDGSLQASGNLESRLNSSKGGGSPLPQDVKTFMESRFRTDFSQVRVHTDSEAVQMSRDVNAQAFTHKQDVYFGEGKLPGKDVLTAHELAHVVQQSGGTGANSLSAKLYRHPAGAGLSVDPEAAVAEVQNPPAARHAVATTSTSPATSPSSNTPASATAPPQQTATPSIGAPTPAQATPAPAPAPASPQAMSLAEAQRVLQNSYGTTHTIIPGNIVLLADRAATWAKYDEINRGRNNIHVTPNRPWQDGDAQTCLPGLEGFADSDTGTVYVNTQTPLTTATAHEMLHLNTASDFRSAVGETINEGATEHLALKALTAAGVPIGSAVAYPTQVSIVRKLIGLVGEGTLTQAYFGGAGVLVNGYEAFHGDDTFTVLKGYAEALDTAHLDPLLQPPSVAQKIAAINALLDGWVSDNDIAAIRGICGSASDSDMNAIRAAIQPRISELWSIGKRTQLRVILGTV